MSDGFETGQVVQVDTDEGRIYMRLAENGNWYELSERVSGGMSKKELFRAGDVEPLIPRSKILPSGPGNGPLLAPVAPADPAEYTGEGQTLSGKSEAVSHPPVAGRDTDEFATHYEPET